MADSTVTGWGLWRRWVLSSALGAGAAAIVARPVSMALGRAAGQSMGAIVAEAATGAVALGGVMLGIAVAQWIAARRHLPRAGRLAVATTTAGVAGGAVGLGAWTAVSGPAGQAAAVAVAAAVGLGTFGTAQWWVLRRQVAWAGRWATASVAGLVAATVALALVSAVVGDGFGAGFGGGMVYGACYGVVTGGAVMIFTKPP